ncbi:hypothetical protein Acr_01g0009330 [Actinidia rufa]|uniref:Uncharacterized protein n=1 Tax=Actinidia rufa TaxID=165716 RepID=A0A7J0E3P7_9ERIC|nr:hypothetical protein Acr_01g0009330 [Actinidia rufa]
MLFVDGSSNQHGCRAGLVLQTPTGDQIEYAIRSGFKATNNEVEYEALLAGLRVATDLGVHFLDIFSDSQLVVNQVQGHYLAKDPSMVAYLDEVKAMIEKIGNFKICQIPKEENKKADALANLASSFDFISDRSIPTEFLASPSIRIVEASGIDILGSLPQAPLQRRFLIVAIDYFTKWIVAQPLVKITEKNTRDFLWKHIVCRFRIPKVIISDNAKQFDDEKLRRLYLDLTISHHFFSPGHPQANGQVKVTNRTILKNLKARLERSKSEWVEELPGILWAYHTTNRISTGETPYSMVFGIESVIPIEIGMPNFRTSNFSEENNKIELCLNLTYLMRKEKKPICVKQHTNGVSPDIITRGLSIDLSSPTTWFSERSPYLPRKLSERKLGPTWESPYKVTKASRLGTY